MPLVPIALALAQYAPQLMRFFGAGEQSTAVAEKVVGIAQSMTGAATPAEALEQIRANADFQREFAMKTLAVDADLERAYLADRTDARARDVEVRKLTGGSNRRADTMLALAFASVIAISALLALGKVDGATAIGGFLMTIGGMFARNIGTAFDFEFGSSRGSKDKDDINVALMQRMAAAPIVDKSIEAPR